VNRLASAGQLRASFIRWAIFLVPLVLLLGYLSGEIAGSAADSPWFSALTKPSTFPPPVTFGIVWSILYVLMGLALALVCSAWGARGRSLAILAFIVQLAINLCWSPVFFGWHRIEIALWVIVALDIAVIVTIFLFWRVRRAAALLMLPYLAWILFATVLNWQFMVMNPDVREVSGAVQRYEL
jgi:tryptophan-rich sensory protein